MAEDKEQSKLAVVTDWNSVPDSDPLQLDLTEDAWTYGAPPPHGVYSLKLFPAKECVKVGYVDKNDPKSVYFMINYEGVVVSENEDYNDARVFGSVSTRVFRGKNISTAAGLLVKAGASKAIPQNPTDKQIAQLTEKLLKKEITILAELDWRGQYQDKDNKGADIYVAVFNHYEDFPIDTEKGGRKHEVQVAKKSGGSADVRAQLRVVRFFSKTDQLPQIAPPPQKGMVAGVGAMPTPVFSGMPLQNPNTPQFHSQMQQQQAPTPQFVPQQQQPQQQPTNTGDAELLLE